MSHPMAAGSAPFTDAVNIESRPAYQAYQILHWTFVAGLLVAGVDTFLHLLVNWDKYLAPIVSQNIHLNNHSIMSIIAVIDIVLALIVAMKPRIGAYLAVLWFALGIANLIQLQGYYDIAFRDLGLLMAAFALGRLSSAHDEAKRAAGKV